VEVSGLAPSDIEAALGALANMTFKEGVDDQSTVASTAVLGARTVHLIDPSGPTPSYSLSSQSPSIDSCVIRFCSCGHRCSGSYTPRVATCSIESDPSNGSAGPISHERNGGRT
jgi:hypothetical protein